MILFSGLALGLGASKASTIGETRINKKKQILILKEILIIKSYYYFLGNI